MATPTRRPKSDKARLTAKRTPRISILVVENHSDTREGIHLFLRALGFRSTSAETIAQASKLAHEQTFDVLLSDLTLPDGNGWDLLENLAKGGRCPKHAVAMSGLGAEVDRARSKAAGFMLHLVKPFQPARLEEVLRQIASGTGLTATVEGKNAPAPSGDLHRKLHDGLCQQLAGGALLQAALVNRLEALGRTGGDDEKPIPAGAEVDALRRGLGEIVLEAKHIGSVFHEALKEVREFMQNLS